MPLSHRVWCSFHALRWSRGGVGEGFATGSLAFIEEGLEERPGPSAVVRYPPEGHWMHVSSSQHHVLHLQTNTIIWKIFPESCSYQGYYFISLVLAHNHYIHYISTQLHSSIRKFKMAYLDSQVVFHLGIALTQICVTSSLCLLCVLEESNLERGMDSSLRVHSVLGSTEKGKLSLLRTFDNKMASLVMLL